MGNIISALNFPEGTAYESFELHTSERPYALTVNLKTDTETRNYYTGALHEAPFQINGCILFALIENVDYVNFRLDDNVLDPYSMQYTSDWAYNITDANLWKESETLDGFKALLTQIGERITDVFDKKGKT